MLAYLSSWRLTRIWFFLVTVSITLYFSIAGTGLEDFRALIRYTARVSAVLIALVYVARSFPHTWLRRQRRYIGVNFAISHLYHLALIIAAGVLFADFKPGLETILTGGIVYLFIIAMLITSFDKPAKKIGPKNWKRLHTVGLHVVFGAFVLNYILGSFRQPQAIPFLVMLVAAFVVRRFISPSA